MVNTLLRHAGLGSRPPLRGSLQQVSKHQEEQAFRGGQVACSNTGSDKVHKQNLKAVPKHQGGTLYRAAQQSRSTQ
eukprot:1157234-Pelagomonas_calceolata.AAC.16